MSGILGRVAICTVAGLLLALPSTAFAAPLDNDDWGNAQALPFFERDATADRTNVGAGIQANEPLTINDPDNGVCSDRRLDHTIWYEITGDGGPVTVHTRLSAIDTIIVVYNTDSDAGSPPPSLDNAIACNDDVNAEDRDSETMFSTQAGFRYLVQVGGCNGCSSTDAEEQGGVEFVAYNAPDNDNHASATPINAGAPVAGDNFGATLQTNERTTCGSAPAVPFARTVWYRYRAPGNGTAVFTSSGIDTVLTVYRGTSFVSCNDDAPGPSTASRIPLSVTAGDYFIQVGGIGVGRDADYGGISMQVEFTPTVVPPRDSDGDGIPDASDACPTQNSAARDANRDGCLDPDPDPDRDGVPLGVDKCPSQNPPHVTPTVTAASTSCRSSGCQRTPACARRRRGMASGSAGCAFRRRRARRSRCAAGPAAGSRSVPRRAGSRWPRPRRR